MKRNISAFFLIIFLSSCSNEPAVSPNYTPGWQPPVVTGIEIADETGLILEIFGNPDFPEDVMDENPPGGSVPETLLAMHSPYPNPADGLQTIPFSISRAAEVKIWVTPAQWVGSPSIPNQSFLESNLINVSGGKAIEILENGSNEFAPGTYHVSWEASEMPVGFYRIYVKAKGITLWRDVYQCNWFEENSCTLQ